MIPVGGITIENDNGAPSNPSDGLIEAFVHTRFEPAGIKGIEIRIQWRVTLYFHLVSTHRRHYKQARNKFGKILRRHEDDTELIDHMRNEYI